MRNYPIKRLWNNLASVRDYIVKDCINKQEDLLLYLVNDQGETEYMHIQWYDLKRKKFQISNKKMKSRYGSGTYELIDFVWKPTFDFGEQGKLL